MVQNHHHRGGGSYYKRTSSSTANFFSKKPSFLSITLYIILLFAFSIFIFLVKTSINILDVDNGTDGQRTVFTEHSQSQSQSQSELESLEIPDEQLWDPPFSYGLHPCVKPTSKYRAAQGSDHYITVKSNGGLNQMRTGIADMVAVAHIMNATLVIPQLDKRSFWKDSSTFSDMFDEAQFIKTLRGDLRIAKELPKELESVPRARKHFTSWSGVGYYEEMTQLFKEYQVIHVAKSDSRLANNDLPLDIQRLRCRALYYALRFSPPIEILGEVLSMHDADTTEAGGAAEITWGKIHSPSSQIRERHAVIYWLYVWSD